MSYEVRRNKVYDWMTSEGISLLIIEDAEGRRDKAVRYLTGHPGDAMLFLSIDRKCLLVPWDDNMARTRAHVDKMLNYTACDMDPYVATSAAVNMLGAQAGTRIEVPSKTPYPAFLRYVETMDKYDVICRDSGAGAMLEQLRSVKDADEIAIYRIAADKTNAIIDALADGVADGALKTETDVALFIESECRKRGCEGIGFETLAAGPERSFAIHAFPAWTAGPFGTDGLSILDFGIVEQGYSTDVTMTFARNLSNKQEKQLALIENAKTQAFNTIAEAFTPDNGPDATLDAKNVAQVVNEVFAGAKRRMPHGLGHGIGLDVHEAPFLRCNVEKAWPLKRGMIFTLEPGLYDPELGGCRFEDDVLITDNGPQWLTRSRIVRL